jgi:hypothetical protein
VFVVFVAWGCVFPREFFPGGVGGGAGWVMAKNFIAGAIKRPGQLHRDLGVPQGKKIPAGKIAVAR